VTIKGGTNVPLAPSIDYLTSVLLPTLSKIGLPPIHINLLKRGWSAGAHEIGAVTITVEPLAPGSCLPGFSLTERGEVVSVKAMVLAPRAAEKDFQREIRAQLGKVLPDVPVEIKFELSGHQKRLYLLLVATTSTGCKLGRDWLYDRRFTSLSSVVSEMARRVVEESDAEIKSGACVDEYCTDQLVVFQALAKGSSVVEGGREESGEPRERSLHARTAEWVVREMIGVEVQENGSCKGVGFVVGEGWRRVDGKKTGGDVEELVEGLEKLEVT
jgi:RNA 3'-terminal phosphate cyclase (ATP)